MLKDGKLVIRIKKKTSNLEVGAPALRQGVVLLPRGQGVPVRAVIEKGVEGEVKETVIEVDDESMSFSFLFVFFFSFESCLLLLFLGFRAFCGETQN